MAYDDAVVLRLLMDDRFSEWVNNPTPELNRYWKQRLARYPEEQPAVEQARHLLQHLDFNKNEHIDREGILANALARASQLPATHAVPHPRFSRFRLAPRYQYLVAAVLVGCLIVVGYWHYLPSEQTYVTAYGESQQIVLPDGSTVVLNANSELRHAREWDSHQSREVALSGEAFFSVTHQTNHQKFIVQTNGLAIEVLGTEFNVNHRRGATKVMLQRGSVRLDWSAGERTEEPSTDTTHQLTIKPGELAVFADQQVTRKAVDPQVYSAWTDDEWVFDKTPLTEVLAMLEDNYGYQIVADEAVVKDKVFTAEIHRADPQLLLTFLSESFNLAITRDERTITLRDKETIDR